MATCDVVCNPDIGRSVNSSISFTGRVMIVDPNCQEVVYLTSDTAGGKLGANNRFVTITSSSEAVDLFTAGAPIIADCKTYFANATYGLRRMLNIVWVDPAESLTDELDKVIACNNCWLSFAADKTVIDYTDSAAAVAKYAQASAWAIEHEKMFFALSTDPNDLDSENGGSVKAVLNGIGAHNTTVVWTKGQCEYQLDTIGNPIPDPDNVGEYLTQTVYKARHLIYAGYVAGSDLSKRGLDYTMDAKPVGGTGWVGIKAELLSSSEVAEVTGRMATGVIRDNNNGYANVYIKSDGYTRETAGMTVTGKWIDSIHKSIFVRRRLRAAIAQLLVGNRKVTYDKYGENALANVITFEMSLMQDNRLFSGTPQPYEDTDAYGNPLLRNGTAWALWGGHLATAEPNLQEQRINPLWRVCYTDAGALSFVDLDVCDLYSTGA
ncbi:hypothetical protein GCM10009007_03420 [Formosimonas limnophila]|uniref:Uncharacterized protein n=1 Tax=Formosimonas limnophila TaxID=1384487 RepID=A0A8J3CLE1_9BURK|nr:hypothetical protein [Formosimonas limnophila]GHA66271.1 hypothetical protein GCM10009007_03420 [Formosimonas limnophila]